MQSDKSLQLGALLIISPVLAWGAPPWVSSSSAFDAWSAAAGNITATCQSGFACENIASGLGFLERRLDDLSVGGSSYIQTIITDKTATGAATSLAFANEVYVKIGGQADPAGVDGLFSKFRLQDTSSAPLKFNAKFASGWAASAGAPKMDLTQQISKTETGAVTTGQFDAVAHIILNANPSAPSGPSLVTVDLQQTVDEIRPLTSRAKADFKSAYHWLANYDASGKATGYLFDNSSSRSALIGADQNFGSGGDNGDNGGSSSNVYDVQSYAMKERGGSMVTAAGSVSLPNGKTLAYNAGDNLRATWIGQRFNHWQEDPEDAPDTPGMGMLSNGIQGYHNLSSTSAPIWYFAYGPTNVGPYNWNTSLFGPAPSIVALPYGRTTTSGADESKPGYATLVTGSVDYMLRPPTASASAAPAPLGAWTVANGVITLACPSGFVCSSTTGNDGFLQRNIRSVATGVTYVQTVVTDKTASGTESTVAFSSENFVQINNGNTASVNGVAAKQVLRLSDADGIFNDATYLNTGWAKTASVSTSDIVQNLLANNTVAPNMLFASGFHHASNVNSAGVQTGFFTDIDQVLIGSARINPLNTGNFRNDAMAFVLREKAGDMLTTSGTGSASGDNGGGSVSWTPGQDVKVTWTGQFFTFESDKSALFGQQSYNNLSKTTGPASTATFEDGPGPFSWDINTFGPRPVMPTPRPSGP